MENVDHSEVELESGDPKYMKKDHQKDMNTESEKPLKEAGSDSPKASESKQEENNARAEEEKKREEEKKELLEWKNKYMYLMADMDNLRKRYQKEKEDLLKYGNERLLQDLVEVADNFDRTMTMTPKDQDEKVRNIVIGIEMIAKQLQQVLEKFGLKPVKALGETFNPEVHEAVSEKWVEGAKEHEVLEELQKGHTLNGRLLRPSRVVVAMAQKTITDKA